MPKLNRSGPDLGPWFTAKFDSDCGHCFGPVDEGDWIRYADGEVACEDCAEAATSAG